MRHSRSSHTLRLAVLAAAFVAIAAGCDSRAGIAQFVSLPINSDPTLASLSASAGSFDPAFSSTRTAFNLSIPDTVSTITVTPTAVAPTSTIQVNGQDVTNGSVSRPITLGAGITSIPIVVTAQNGTTRTVTVSAIR